MRNGKIIVFTCNWNAYTGLETAGRKHLQYCPSVYPIKVMCLGKLSPGIILKTFEKGAAGVLMLGCLPDECYYTFGNRHAEEIFQVTSRLLRALGYPEKRFKMDRVAPGDGDAWLEKIDSFVAGLNGDQGSS